MRRLPAPLPPLAPALAPTLPLVLALVLAAGCGSSGPGTAAADDAVVVEVMIEDGRAWPAGDRLEVPVGGTVELVVMSDSVGDIHVHAEEDRRIEFEPGTTTFALELDRPGTVGLELHHPDQLLVQLEVR